MRDDKNQNAFAVMAPPGISLSVSNPVLQAPTIYIGVTTELDFSLVNNTTGDLSLKPASSALEIFFPLAWFTAAQLQAMQIVLADWTFTYDAMDGSLLLIYDGASEGTWAAGTSISFPVTGIVSSAAADASNVQVNISNIPNTPAEVQTSLTLAVPPTPQNASLSDTLALSLDNQGAVYVSTANGMLSDVLPNALYLNLKNTGTMPLYSGTTPWTGSPQVIVTFVYGSTSGSLAPDDDKAHPVTGSAWNIVAAIAVAQSQWQVMKNTGQAPNPSWTLSPVQTNIGILGTGDQANVTFDFTQVISFTPIGHTQMTLLFTGFQQNATTAYNDETFVLDIVKQNAPPTRGLLSLASLSPIVTVTTASQPVVINLRWVMFDVASIQLVCSYPGIAPYLKSYPVNAVPSTYPIGSDTYALTIPGISESTAVFVSVAAFDGLGGFLNTLQFTAYLNLTVFVDPRDGKSYPTIQAGTQIWMAANLDYDALGSIFYNNNSGNEAMYGRLYTISQAEAGLPLPGGWRVPTVSDWNNLISQFGGTPAAAYTALIAGGSSGFNAVLGGAEEGSGTFEDLGTKGYYWTSTSQSSSNTFYTQFSSVSGVTVGQSNFPDSFALSVRLVRDL